MPSECHIHMRDDGTPVMTLTGACDLSSVAHLRDEFKRLIEEGHRRIIVDLNSLDYIDSSGLGVLVGALARLREHDGELAVVVSSAKIRRAFDITKLSYILPLYPSLNAVP